jgi:hypothetical protein
MSAYSWNSSPGQFSEQNRVRLLLLIHYKHLPIHLFKSPGLRSMGLNLLHGFFAGLRIRIRIGSGFNQVSGSGFGIKIRIQEGKNNPQK